MMRKGFLVNRCSHMPRIVSVPLSLEQRERLIFLVKRGGSGNLNNTYK